MMEESYSSLYDGGKLLLFVWWRKVIVLCMMEESYCSLYDGGKLLFLYDGGKL